MPTIPLALALLVMVAAPGAAARQAPAGAPPELLEAPRIAVVFKAGASAAKARDAWRAAVDAHESEPEVVLFDALPPSAAKVPGVPRWLIVFEDAKSQGLAPRTVEYEHGLGRSARIRYRGATAQGRARIYEMGEKPVEVAVLGDSMDESYPAKEELFAPDESKKEVVIDPGDMLDRLVARMVGRALALGSAIDLWRERAALVPLSAGLDAAQSARFWRRASAVTLDPGHGTTPVPWHSLETSAVDLWERAPADAARSARPASSCAWCEAPAPAEGSACGCDAARALGAAKRILAHSFGRENADGTRTAALAVAVPFEHLDPSRAEGWKAGVAKLAERLDAEHAADRARLAARVGLRAERVRGKQTYAILVLRDPSSWRPSDPDLERHASELLQVFRMGSPDVRSYYGADAARPGLALARWDAKTSWYAAFGRREFGGAAAEIESLVLRAMWDNARGVETEPARPPSSAR
jgi:hypothetical protein